MRLVLLLVLVLAGCGGSQEQTNNDPPLPISFAYTGSTGTRVAYDPDVSSRDQGFFFENEFQTAVSCLFNHGWISDPNVSGPTVEIVTYYPQDHGGYTYYSNGLIQLNQYSVVWMQHETIHYLLHVDHTHPAFSECDPSYRFI